MLDYPLRSRHRSSARAAHGVRPERHSPGSIATLRAIARQLLGAVASLSFLWRALRIIIFGVDVRFDDTGCRT
jgi:hypothetical protein